MQFTDQSESFVLGYECGLIDSAIKNGDYSSRYIHIKNQVQITEIARLYGFRVVFSRFDDVWSLMQLIRIETEGNSR